MLNVLSFEGGRFDSEFVQVQDRAGYTDLLGKSGAWEVRY